MNNRRLPADYWKESTGKKVIAIGKQFVTCKEIMEIMDVSESTAYKIIRLLNSQLQAAGYITIQGKVARRYFEEKCLYGTQEGR